MGSTPTRPAALAEAIRPGALAEAVAWLAELDEAIVDGDLTQYRATCQVLKATLDGDHSPEVIQLFEEYMRCHSV